MNNLFFKILLGICGNATETYHACYKMAQTFQKKGIANKIKHL